MFLLQDLKRELRRLTHHLNAKWCTLITSCFLIGLLGLAALWALNAISVNELAKSAALMAFCVYGLAGSIVVWSDSERWFRRAVRGIWFVFFLDAVVKGFLRNYFGLRPDPDMVLQAVLNTHAGETTEFITQQWRSLAFSIVLLVTVVTVTLWLEGRLRQKRSHSFPARRVVRIGVSVMLVLLVAVHFNRTMARENPLLFWPLRYQAYQKELLEMAELRKQIADKRSQPHEWAVSYHGEAKRTVVWVIGESINRNNMSLYGYPRATTPRLDAMRDRLLVFTDTISAESATMGSLMKKLTPASLTHPESWIDKPDILQLAKAAGYKTFWLSNQAASDGWLGLVAEQADTLRYINRGQGRGENNIDGNLIPEVDTVLADTAPKKFIVVHLLGAHPTYYMRYPKEFARFDGVEDEVAAELKASDRSFWIRQQRDEYDNAILYSDYVLSEILSRVVTSERSSSAAVIYSADHGQEVGHNRDHAGHSAVDNSGFETPLVIWKDGLSALPDKDVLQTRPYQSDLIEHTVLGLLRVDSVYYDPRQDLLSSRFTASPRFVGGRPYRQNEQPRN
jgi:heptose-I-phosphate ethanolaminephosphotransferase